MEPNVDESNKKKNRVSVFANTSQPRQNDRELVHKTYELGVDELPVLWPKGATASHTTRGSEGISPPPPPGTSTMSTAVLVSAQSPIKEGLEIVSWTGNYDRNQVL